ncbi:hypothetical protein NHH73_00030 [Oxalobacteraceae bacterium OTU3CINTB1]|nr:hypothetical protein NHH73_00030 [Oxalobacteraceae bacterium OTU3CINTB1]
MIFQSNPPINPWTRCAVIFFIFNSLTIFFTWMVFDVVGKPQNFTGPTWLTVVGISVLLYFLGAFFRVERLRIVILILGFFVALPGFIFFTVPIFLMMEAADVELDVKVIIWLTYVLLTCLCCVFQARKIIDIENKNDYLRKNIRIKMSIGFFYPYCAEMLGCGHRDARFSRGEILRMISPIIFLGYPLQRLIVAYGGNVGFFGVIAILTIPLAIYIAGKISAGYFFVDIFGRQF